MSDDPASSTVSGVAELYNIARQPELSDWECRLMNFTYRPPKKNEPNWFHRKMMTLFFGCEWRKR